MSDSATFELETTVKEEVMFGEISSLWQGFGYYVDIYSYPEQSNRVFCTLDYIYGYSEEEGMIRKAVDYLLKRQFGIRKGELLLLERTTDICDPA